MRGAVIADDEPIIRMDLSQMLEEIGFSVVSAVSDGFDAVECCRLHRPDLAILDIKMPIFDGLGAAERIIADDIAGCVMILTAFADREFWERARDAGVSGYILKPVNELGLLPTIEIAMEQSRRRRELERALRETKAVDRAKAMIARRDGISEGEAYAVLTKMSMDKQRPIAEIAEMLLRADPCRAASSRAKELLMRGGMSEKRAWRAIRELSERRGVSAADAARAIIAAGGMPKGHA